MHRLAPFALALVLVACDDGATSTETDATTADAEEDATQAAETTAPDTEEDAPDTSAGDFFADAPDLVPGEVSTWTPETCPAPADVNSNRVRTSGDWIMAHPAAFERGIVDSVVYFPTMEDGEGVNFGQWRADDLEPGACIGGTYYMVDVAGLVVEPGSVYESGRVIMIR